MKINIKDHEIELQYCMRMYIKYEERTGKSVSFDGMSSYTGITDLMYCAIAATLEHKKYRDLGLTLSYEEFLDWTDDQNGNKLLEDFNKWLIDIVKSQNDTKGEVETEDSAEVDPN